MGTWWASWLRSVPWACAGSRLRQPEGGDTSGLVLDARQPRLFPDGRQRRPRRPRGTWGHRVPHSDRPGRGGKWAWAVGTRAGSRAHLGQNRQEGRAQGTSRAPHSVRGGRATKIRNSANFCECGLKTLRPGVRDAETSHWTCLQLTPGPPEHCGSEASGGLASLTPRCPPAAEPWGQGRMSPLLPLAPEPERREPFRCEGGGHSACVGP